MCFILKIPKRIRMNLRNFYSEVFMLNKLFKSVLEQDRASVVICDLTDTIVYMNPAAVKSYHKYGGEALLGSNIMDCHNERSQGIIRKVVSWFAESKDNNMIYTVYDEKRNKDEYIVALRDENGELIGYYEKHEFRNPETAEHYDYSKSLI